MEPLAPGTEDEEQHLFAPPSRKDSEHERLLGLKAVLQNGQYGNVFELSHQGGLEKWYCNLCQCPVMGQVYTHENGKRHTFNLSIKNSNFSRNQNYPSKNQEPSDTPIHIAPGEPVPPGFEGEVVKVAQLQETLDLFKCGPLVGLEYLLEMNEDDTDKEPAYLCFLCEKKGDPRTIIAHLSSYMHMLQYIQRHFPSCYRKMSPYLTNQYKRGLQATANRIAEAIEHKFGRLKPIVVDKDAYEKNRSHYTNMINYGKHFSEKAGVYFDNLVIKEEIMKASTLRAPIEENKGPSKRDPSPPVVKIPQKKRGLPPSNREEQKPLSISSISDNEDSDRESQKSKPKYNNSPAKYVRKPPPYNRSPPGQYGKKSKSLPWQSDYKHKKEYSKDHEPSKSKMDKFEEFRKIANAIEDDLLKQLRIYERNPEKHPQYNEEWNAFWNKRWKEWQAKAKDPSKFDCKPEWKEYWSKKMKDIHNIELKSKKDALRKRLSLPIEPAPICFRITGKKKPVSSDGGLEPLHPESLGRRSPSRGDRRSLSSVSSLSSMDLSDSADNTVPKRRRMSPGIYEPSDKYFGGRKAFVDRKKEDKSWIKLKENSEYAHITIEKVEEYKKLATAIETDMEKQLKIHEKNPEKHPQYNDEWKLFWNKRYKELQTEGKDASKYDFKPEWIEFWNKRMRDLHEVDVKVKKEALRKRLSLPEESILFSLQFNNKRQGQDKVGKQSKPVPVAAQPDQDHEVIIIDDVEESSLRSHSPWEREPVVKTSSRRSRDKSRDKSLDRGRKSRDRDNRSRDRDNRSRDREYYPRGRERERDRGRDRSPPRRFSKETSWDRDVQHFRSYKKEMEYYKSRKEHSAPMYYVPMRDVTSHPVYEYKAGKKPLAEEVPGDVDENVNVVGMLRLLTALEERLGSLGPKVNDLLATALAMENKAPNSSETLLDDESNCVLFETVKEKLKGQLLAGLVDEIQERAFKNAIKKIASIIHVANGRKKEQELQNIKNDQIKIQGIGEVNKEEIARNLTVALIKQGRTDVTQAELEQLILAVVGMQEAAERASKPLNTSTFPFILENKTENKPQPASDSKGTSIEEDIKHMDHLSDSDLQTLLQNFNDLSSGEQKTLIAFLKKLESEDPARVERMRKFVKISTDDSLKPTEKSEESSRASPFSSRADNANPQMFDEEEHTVRRGDNSPDDSKRSLIGIDSDDEEYDFEEVVQAAKKKVIQKEQEEKKEKDKKKEVELNDTKNIIANLLRSISKNNENTNSNSGESEKSSNQRVQGLSMDNFQNFSLSSLNSIMNNANQLPHQTDRPTSRESKEDNFVEDRSNDSLSMPLKLNIESRIPPVGSGPSSDNSLQKGSLSSPGNFSNSRNFGDRTGSFDYDNGFSATGNRSGPMGPVTRDMGALGSRNIGAGPNSCFEHGPGAIGSRPMSGGPMDPGQLSTGSLDSTSINLNSSVARNKGPGPIETRPFGSAPAGTLSSGNMGLNPMGPGPINQGPMGARSMNYGGSVSRNPMNESLMEPGSFGVNNSNRSDDMRQRPEYPPMKNVQYPYEKPHGFPQEEGFPQSHGFPKGGGYPHDGGYSQDRGYPHDGGYPQDDGYSQDGGYPRDFGYAQAGGYQQDRRYPQEGNYPPNNSYKNRSEPYGRPNNFYNEQGGRYGGGGAYNRGNWNR